MAVAKSLRRLDAALARHKKANDLRFVRVRGVWRLVSRGIDAPRQIMSSARARWTAGWGCLRLYRDSSSGGGSGGGSGSSRGSGSKSEPLQQEGLETNHRVEICERARARYRCTGVYTWAARVRGARRARDAMGSAERTVRESGTAVSMSAERECGTAVQ